MSEPLPEAPFLPYGRQTITSDDIDAVIEVLEGDWLTTGPKVAEFEQVVARAAGVAHGVAMANGTAALQAMMASVGIGPGDEVIVPSMTFVATANSVVMQGGQPVFADVSPDTLLIDPESAATCVTPRTKAVVGVDFAGQPADYGALRDVVPEGCAVLADAAHSIGGADGGRPVGSLADATIFSFHPVKTVTTGEGGMVVTDDEGIDDRARAFRNHGIAVDHHARSKEVSFEYDMTSLGINGRLTDLQCALGRSQMDHLDEWVTQRQSLSALYDDALENVDGITPISTRAGVHHGRHLYVVRIDPTTFGHHRDEVFRALRDANIGVNVHYRPVHTHSYYRTQHATRNGDCPVAEAAYQEILSLPLFPAMADEDVGRVLDALTEIQRA